MTLHRQSRGSDAAQLAEELRTGCTVIAAGAQLLRDSAGREDRALLDAIEPGAIRIAGAVPGLVLAHDRQSPAASPWCRGHDPQGGPR